MTTEASEYPTVAELQAQSIPRANASELFGYTGEGEEAKALYDTFIESAQAYLNDFCATSRCPRCTTPEEAQKPLNPLLDMFTGVGFEWGLAHGETYCRRCHYPGRGLHLIKYDGGEVTLNASLPYHPSALTETATV